MKSTLSPPNLQRVSIEEVASVFPAGKAIPGECTNASLTLRIGGALISHLLGDLGGDWPVVFGGDWDVIRTVHQKRHRHGFTPRILGGILGKSVRKL